MPPSVRLAIKITKNSAKHLKVSWKDDASSQFKVALSLRGMTPHIVHSTELAKQVIVAPQKANEFITGTLPAIPMDGRLFIESTANGMAGYFYDTFMSGWKKKENITKDMSRAQPYPLFYNWQWDEMDMGMIEEPIPTHLMDETPDIKWKEYQEEHGLSDIEITYYYLKWKSLGEDIHKLQQEYPTTPQEAFGSSGMTYLSQAKLFKHKQELREPYRYHISNDMELIPDNTGDLYLYREFDKSKSYVIGGDVAEGLANGDWSVLCIVEATTKELVGIYYCKEEPYEFAQIANRIGRYFNNALLAVESNKDGLYVNDMLVQLDYPNLYYQEEVDSVTKQVNAKMGWKTTSSSRPYALAALKTAFTKGDFWSQGLFIDEALTFVVNARGRAEAMSGKHDDVVMSLAIAYAVMENKHFTDLKKSTTGDNSLMAWAFGEITPDQLDVETQKSLGFFDIN